MREILFKGKRVDNGEWIYGSLICRDSRCYIVDESDRIALRKLVTHYEDKYEYRCVRVVPESVGQFTGLTDKNGKKIFEGDILVFCQGATYPYKIIWDGIGWKLIRSDGKRIKEAFECNEIHYVNISEIIGNIYDNPELLGGEDNA